MLIFKQKSKKRLSIRKLGNSLKNKFKNSFKNDHSTLFNEPIPIFGTDLEQLLIKERLESNDHSIFVPSIVQSCISYLIPKYENVVGIFRINGNQKDILTYRENMNNGITVSFENEENCHNISNLLKLFIRELPDPLIPIDIQDELLTCLTIRDEQKKLEEIHKLLALIPKSNLYVLKDIVYMLNRLSKNSNINKMDSQNLSTVWTPNIFWNHNKEKDTGTYLKFSNERNELMKIIIENPDIVLQDIDFDSVPTPQKKKRRKSVIDFFNNDLLESDEHYREEKRYSIACLDDIYKDAKSSNLTPKSSRQKEYERKRPRSIITESPTKYESKPKKINNKRSIVFRPTFKLSDVL